MLCHARVKRGLRGEKGLLIPVSYPCHVRVKGRSRGEKGSSNSGGTSVKSKLYSQDGKVISRRLESVPKAEPRVKLEERL